MSMVEPAIAQALSNHIKRIESGTDLKRVAIISRSGMKIATATTSTMDADAETGSSAALISLSEELTTSVNHGNLRELLIRGKDGFVILQFINPEFMVFGGISNPNRVGYYLEYLRNEAHKFAYILAGNKVTEELKEEIEKQKTRDKGADEMQNLGKMFKSDRSTGKDMQAIEGVLDFLQDWGGEDEVAAGTSVGLGFGDVGDLGATSISPDEIAKAQQISGGQTQHEVGASVAEKIGITPALSEEDSINEALDALDAFTTGMSSDSVPVGNDIAISTDEGVPDDILATLGEIADSVSGGSSSSAPSVVSQATEDINPDIAKYGIKIYDGEVPPIPLSDYVSFEVGSRTNGAEEVPPQEEYVAPDAGGGFDEYGGNEFGMEIPMGEDGEPDFDAMVADEYLDPDLELEEDALVDALNEIEKEEKKRNQ